MGLSKINCASLFPLTRCSNRSGVFGVLAMMLAATGLCALLVYSVARRITLAGGRPQSAVLYGNQPTRPGDLRYGAPAHDRCRAAGLLNPTMCAIDVDPAHSSENNKSADSFFIG